MAIGNTDGMVVVPEVVMQEMENVVS